MVEWEDTGFTFPPTPPPHKLLIERLSLKPNWGLQDNSSTTQAVKEDLHGVWPKRGGTHS